MNPPKIPEENLRNGFNGRRQSQGQNQNQNHTQSQTQGGDDNHNNDDNDGKSGGPGGSSTNTPTRFAGARQKGGRPPGSSGTRQNFTTEQKEYLLTFLVTKDNIVHIITNTGLIRRKLLDELQLAFEATFGEFRSTAVLLQRCKGFYEKYQEAEAAFNEEDASSDEAVAERVHNKRMQICPYFDRIAQALAANRDQVDNPEHQQRKRKRVSEIIEHNALRRVENGSDSRRSSSVAALDMAAPPPPGRVGSISGNGGTNIDWRQRQLDQDYKIASERLALDREIANRQFALQDREMRFYDWVEQKVGDIEQEMAEGRIGITSGYELMAAFMNSARK